MRWIHRRAPCWPDYFLLYLVELFWVVDNMGWWMWLRRKCESRSLGGQCSRDHIRKDILWSSILEDSWMLPGRCPSFQDVANVREERWWRKLQSERWSYLLVIENANVGDLSLNKLFDPAVDLNKMVNYLDELWGLRVLCRGNSRLSTLGQRKRSRKP